MLKTHMSATHFDAKTALTLPEAMNYLASMPDLDMVLAENVRAIRIALGMTQEEFAEAMSVSQGAVSRMESGESFRRFKKLADQVRRAGGDPGDLLRPGAFGPADALSAEIRELLPKVDADVREMVLAMLRRLADASEAVKKASAL